VVKQDNSNGNKAFCEGLPNPATSLSQSIGKSSTKGNTRRGPHQLVLVAKQTQLAMQASTHGRPLTAEDIANIAIGPSSLDIYLRFEDRSERCKLGLSGDRAGDFILDPKLAQVLETL
jgi:hypothetical protein